MKTKTLGFVLGAVAAGTILAWAAADNDLFGASPTWIPSTAVYPPVRSLVEPVPCQEGESVPQGPTPGPGEEGREPPPEPAANPAPESGTAAPFGIPGHPLFPPRAEPAGFERFVAERGEDYEIRSGDTLAAIGKALAVPHELLARMNAVEPDRIRAGDRLRVVRGPFHVLVHRDRFRLCLYADGVLVETFPVAVGRPGRETCLGEFRVQTKMVEPQWTDPDTGRVVAFGTTENPLGTRWIGFNGGFGIHGTWEPETLGTAASRGCVRLRNADAELLFDFLCRGGSVVEIVDARAPKGAGPAGEEREED